ncbi:MAG: NifB/NifX family molybdenum-iron cluster-binding protein [Roseicyclus sp.]
MPVRRLSLVAPPEATAVVDRGVRVAFASSDHRHVDQHFGSATAFVIHVVVRETSRLLEIVTFPPELEDGRESKLETRIGALETCDAVYVQAIGASAIGQLRRAGIQPLKAAPGTPIRRLVAELQQEFADARRTGRVTAAGKDPARFDAFDAEHWDD